MHTQFTLFYCLAMVAASVGMWVFQVQMVAWPLVWLFVALSGLVFVPMKSMFRGMEFLSLGWIYWGYGLAGLASAGLVGLQVSLQPGKNPGPADISLVAAGLAFFLYYLPAREVLRRNG